MYVLPVNIIQNHYVPNFEGNKMPQAVLEKQKEVLKELDISTGTSYVAGLLRKPENAQLNDFLSQLWQNLKSNMPFADTVEKLELLKTYGISILSYTKEETSKFLKFLKSNPTDKDVFFLQTAIDIARRGQIERIENGTPHFLFDDFEPVLNYVLSNKKGKVDFSGFTRKHIENHIDAMSAVHYKNKGATKTDAKNIISTINELLTNTNKSMAYYGHHKYGTKSIKSELADKYINIGALDVDGNTEITIGLSDSRCIDFYDYYFGVPPTDKQMFILLDKNKKLSKLKLYSYSKYKNAEYSNDYDYYSEQEEQLKRNRIFLNRYDSPFKDELPDWIQYGYNIKKYRLRTIEYDVATQTAELKHYEGRSEYYPQKFKLVDVFSDKLGIMTDDNNSISFMPVEPTGYDLEQMINNEKTNNLIKVLNFSGWKDCFMKIIHEYIKK